MHRQSRGVDPELFAPSAQSSSSDRYAKDPPSSASSSFGSRGTSTSSSSHDGFRNDYGDIYASGNNQAPQETNNYPGLTLELEHLSGFTGKGKNTIHAHPADPDSYITWYELAVCSVLCLRKL
jgi:hypothetical protein